MKKNILLLVLSFPFVIFSSSDQAIEKFREVQPHYLNLAWGKLNQSQKIKRSSWPIDVLSIGHTMASFQNYYNTRSGSYFHHGIDIRGHEEGQVYSSTSGQVVNIENYASGHLYWEVAILDDHGFLWQYHHIKKESIPRKIWQAFQVKGRIEEGEFIGKIVSWPVFTFGEYFHHIHLNILDRDGNYLNPFQFLEKLDDHQKPDISEVGLLNNGRYKFGNKTNSDYSLYVKVKDLIKHDKFFVPPYEIKMNFNDSENDFLVWRFDSLPGGEDKKKFVNEFYLFPYTSGNYISREIVIDLGFNGRNKKFPKSFQTHKVEVKVKDYLGNKTSKVFFYTLEKDEE